VSRRVQIAGAGIAGLTTALFLARAGFEVDVAERALSLEPVGAGLQLSPNATRLLDRLGLLPALQAASVAPEAIELRDARNLKPLASVALGDFAARRWGAPYLVIHRGDLQRILLDAALREPQINIRFGSEIDPSKNADLTIGADGVWSTMRARIPGASPASFSGHVAWRALVEVGHSAFAGLAAQLSPTNVSALLAPALPIRSGRGRRSIWSRSCRARPARRAGRKTWPTWRRYRTTDQALCVICFQAWAAGRAGRSMPSNHPANGATRADSSSAMPLMR
jgi:2-polyprenyl-6-methoxyphenol hydroxylase-like FAD-dependent oxidoreductase